MIPATDIDYTKLKIATATVFALASEKRLTIMKFISEHQEINVKNIAITLSSSESTISQHLKILRLVELVTARREGRDVFYSLNRSLVEQTLAFCEHMSHL